jgi:hypothetical protein
MAFGEEAEQRWGAAILGSLALVAAFVIPWLLFSHFWVESGSMTRYFASRTKDGLPILGLTEWLLRFPLLKVFLLTGMAFFCHACMTHRYDLLERVAWMLVLFLGVNLTAAFGWIWLSADFAKIWPGPGLQGQYEEFGFWYWSLIFDWTFLTLTLLAWGVWMAKLTGLPRK